MSQTPWNEQPAPSANAALNSGQSGPTSLPSPRSTGQPTASRETSVTSAVASAPDAHPQPATAPTPQTEVPTPQPLPQQTNLAAERPSPSVLPASIAQPSNPSPQPQPTHPAASEPVSAIAQPAAPSVDSVASPVPVPQQTVPQPPVGTSEVKTEEPQAVFSAPISAPASTPAQPITHQEAPAVSVPSPNNASSAVTPAASVVPLANPTGSVPSPISAQPQAAPQPQPVPSAGSAPVTVGNTTGPAEPAKTDSSGTPIIEPAQPVTQPAQPAPVDQPQPAGYPKEESASTPKQGVTPLPQPVHVPSMEPQQQQQQPPVLPSLAQPPQLAQPQHLQHLQPQGMPGQQPMMGQYLQMYPYGQIQPHLGYLHQQPGQPQQQQYQQMMQGQPQQLPQQQGQPAQPPQPQAQPQAQQQTQQPPQPPQPPQVPLPQGQQPQGDDRYRQDANMNNQLNDALTYLDQVKVRYRNRPGVYNHFLDIMKDFKSQNIDTPGVIDRVSSLFRGHNDLIQGFNTFLPNGYRIDCVSDGVDTNHIQVTTPMGVQIRPDSVDYERWSEGQQQQQQQQQQQLQQQQLQQPGQQARHEYEVAQSVAGGPQQLVPAMGMVGGQPQVGLPMMGQGQMDMVHGSAQGAHVGNGGPVEFDYTIAYVNRIRNRFANQPDVYKSFLEILQTYQRMQLDMGEVYAQVSQLFRDAPDLLEDFKRFLPGGRADNKMRLPPVGSFGPPAQQPKKQREPQQSSVRDTPLPGMLAQQPPGANVPSVTEQNLVPAAQVLVPPSRKSSMADEIAFFDKVKRALPKQSYHELLKVINLFTQRIIDVNTLVSRVDGFIGQFPELMEWFKRFVGYEGKPLSIENIAAKKHQVDLAQCRACGPSYRLLPKTEKYMPCSGRDEMCWEVLNDEWVGHPTWASEDSGFVAHRKNQYEEILYRIEEERHEYDHFIGANQRTIQVLSTIANRIANMTPQEQAEFKLPEGLGHTTKIYQKVINKIYDKKNGAEVINALHENPGVAVPIVLHRLKQKDEEWKRAHREWNKVWRETEQKVFYKSLDHIGLTFKQADRKQLTSRALLSQIMAIKAEQGAKRKSTVMPTPKSQIVVKIDDNQVLTDLWKLLLRFLEHSGSYSAHDRELMVQFLRSFLPIFFGLDNETVARVYPSDKRPREEESSTAAGDLALGDILKRSKGSDDEEDVKMEDAAGTPAGEAQSVDTEGAREGTAAAPAANEPQPSANEDEAAWLRFERLTPPLEEPSAVRTSFNLFANTPIYLFLRLFEIIYARLAEVKSYEPIVSKELEVQTSTTFAKDLCLFDTKMDDLGLRFSPEHCYEQALALCEKLLDGDVEPQWFEESLRRAYRNRAYKLYTIDKTLHLLVKQLHTLVNDQATADVLLLFDADRRATESDVKQQIVYRMKVKQLIGAEEPIFRIDWAPGTAELGFQYLGTYDLTLKGVAQAQSKWEYYVTSYMMNVPTEGVPFDKIKAPFLYRSLRESLGDDFKCEVLSQGLQARVCINTYRLFFEQGTADYIMRKADSWDEHRAEAKTRREKRFQAFLDGVEAAVAEPAPIAEPEAADPTTTTAADSAPPAPTSPDAAAVEPPAQQPETTGEQPEAVATAAVAAEDSNKMEID